MSSNPMDAQLANACARSSEYPRTILRGIRAHEYETLNLRCEKLHSERDNLFDDEDQKLEFWDCGENNQFQRYEFHDVEEARKHLDLSRPDPLIRHVFLESADSRSPLNCSSSMLKTIFTYHQVEPSFLDLVHAFGDQDEPKDMCLMSFKAYDTLTKPQQKLVKISQLGRQGREIHISYLLRAPEFKKSTPWPWQIRQAAVYHSFDVDTGKAFWCTIKGNDEFGRRTKDCAPYLDLPAANSGHMAASQYFKASLATHLVYLSWCDDTWRQFINDIEDGIRQILELARRAPIDDDLKDKAKSLAAYPRSLRHTMTKNSTATSRTHTGLTSAQQSTRGGKLKRQLTWEVITGARAILYASIRAKSKKELNDPEKAIGGTVNPVQSTERLVDPRAILSRFRFSDVQTLYTFSDRIQRAILTLQLNISVLQELHVYYRNRLATDTIPAFRHIQQACADDLTEFLYEVHALSKRLETRKAQLECLAKLLSEGNALYDGILQYRQLDISQRFQETAQESTAHMQTVADKTRVETASMHVITVVTMIFLPATFVALIFWFVVIFWGENRPSFKAVSFSGTMIPPRT